MQISKIFTKKKNHGEPATLVLQIFLALSFFIFLILSRFTIIAIYSDILDIFEGNFIFTFLLPDFVLLLGAFIWFYAMLTLSLRHLKSRASWLYIYGPVIVLFISILYLI